MKIERLMEIVKVAIDEWQNRPSNNAKDPRTPIPGAVGAKSGRVRLNPKTDGVHGPGARVNRPKARKSVPHG